MRALKLTCFLLLKWLCTLCTAKIQQMQQMMELLAEQMVKDDPQVIQQLGRMGAGFPRPPPSLRVNTGSDKGLLEFQVPYLDGYGCWCRITAETFGTGKGTGQDVYDELCQDLHRATECLMIDFHENCNPWTEDYNFAVGIFSVDCTNANQGDDCKINLCRAEANFVMAVLHLATSFTVAPFNHAYYNPNAPQYTGEWTYDQCGNSAKFSNETRPPKPGAIDQVPATDWVTECCGQYPIRYPFRSQAFDEFGNLITDRDCCDFDNGDYGTKVYDLEKLECCDGDVTAIGTC